MEWAIIASCVTIYKSVCIDNIVPQFKFIFVLKFPEERTSVVSGIKSAELQQE